MWNPNTYGIYNIYGKVTISFNLGNGAFIRCWLVSSENVAATLRTLIEGAEQYHGGNLLVHVTGSETAAKERERMMERR